MSTRSERLIPYDNLDTGTAAAPRDFSKARRNMQIGGAVLLGASMGFTSPDADSMEIGDTSARIVRDINSLGVLAAHEIKLVFTPKTAEYLTQEQRDATNYLYQAKVRGEEVAIFSMKADRGGAEVTNVPILGLEGIELGNDEKRVLRVLRRFDEGESLNVSRWYGSFPLVYEHGSPKFALTLLDSGEVGFVPWKDLK